MKSLSKTPAPAKDRISGSKVNPKGSASSEKSASQIKLDAKTIVALSNKLKEFKESHTNKNITLNDLKAVYRRGAGAYSSSHRPTISGGKPNSRNAWAMARVNKFLLKAGGTKVKKAYVQDDDLMKMHLGGDMSKHLAPNGKPSNLTHEQWHMVRTPKFKAWFGDWENNPNKASKVIDSNGEPLVLYHGTTQDFNAFYGGAFFTDDYMNADGYASGEIVLENYLNIKKPLIIQANGRKWDNLDTDYGKTTQEVVMNLNRRKYDGIIFLNINDNWIDDEEFGEVGNIYYAIRPTQMKFSDGSNNTFDGKNTDMRYADGGEVGQDITCKNCGWEWNTLQSEKHDKYVCHNCGFDNTTYYDKDVLGYKDGGATDKYEISDYWDTELFGGGFVGSKRYWNGYQYKGLYIVKFEGDSWSYWNIWRDEYATKEVAIGFNTKRDAMDWIDENLEKINKGEDDYAKGGVISDKDKAETYKKWKSLVNMSKSELERFYNSQEGKDAGLSTSEANEQGISSGRESARWIMKMKDTPYKEWTPQMWKWAKKQISFISRMSGNKGGLYDDKGNKTRKHTSLLIWGNNPEKMSGGGEAKGEATYKDVVDLLTEYQFRERKTFSDKRYKLWRNSMKINGEEVDCFIDTEGKVIVLESQHGLKEIGYDLKFMESYFKKNRLKRNNYNNGGQINQIKNTNMDNVRFNQLPHIDTISEGDDIILFESVFAGNIDQPKHIGERYIHCKAMKMGGMVNSLDLEVINSVGANPLVIGQLITRPITNVLVKGRKLIVEPIAQAIAFAKGGLDDLYVGDEISYKGNKYEVGGMTDCRNYVRVKDSVSGEAREVDVDEILDNSRLIKRK